MKLKALPTAQPFLGVQVNAAVRVRVALLTVGRWRSGWPRLQEVARILELGNPTGTVDSCQGSLQEYT